MGRVFNLGAAIEAAIVRGKELVAIDNTHGMFVCEHREGAAHMAVRNGVVVQVKAHVGSLADLHGQ